MKKAQKHTLLVGEGIHQHTLYGSFAVGSQESFTDVKVIEESVLRHEKPDGSFSNEHKALQVEKGNWSMGKQVEYNPFEGRITQVWD